MMICDISHETLIMDGSATRTQVALRVAHWLRDMGVEDAEPLARSMHWLNTDVVRDRESVEHVLHGLDRPDDAIWAVRFEHEPEIDALEAELKRERARIESELMQILVETRPSRRTVKFIKCPACGSSIARDHLGNRSMCPVCETDLRRDSERLRIAVKREAIERIDARIDILARTRDEKPGALWAVGLGSCHRP